jgi:iron-sulfur cluster repair protein YtfE (RIC family)
MIETQPPGAGPDVRDMLVVHAALLREFRLAPVAVARAADLPRLRGRVVRHLTLLLEVLEHHHAGEDRLLLPLLAARAPGSVDTAEEQHARLEALIAEVRTALAGWVLPPLVDLLVELHAALETHLRAEEREVLPLAARHLTPAEWGAIGEAGFRSIPKPALPLFFGMMMVEGDPEVLRSMLAEAPPPVRALMPRLGPAVYARHARRLYGAAS